MSYRILSMLFLAGTTVSLAAQSTVSFETYGDKIATNSGPIVAADFNNDGKPDLIECCNSSTQMVFRAGYGNGMFAAPVAAAVTPVALSGLVAADVNGDGNLDLVAVADQNPPAPPLPKMLPTRTVFGAWVVL
jgi:FG-GAP-like repeat